MAERAALARRRSDLVAPQAAAHPEIAGPEGPPQPGALAFKAEIDAAELDSCGRPGAAWSGCGTDLSRSHIWFKSRRMCYRARHLVLAVHLLDADPAPLFGEVASCEYDGEGMYRTQVALMRLPDEEAIHEWIKSRNLRGSV